jgi:hypothetical protein
MTLREFIRPEPRAELRMRVWLAKRNAMLCLDCDAVFACDGLPCPACASTYSMPLARVTDRGRAGA